MATVTSHTKEPTVTITTTQLLAEVREYQKSLDSVDANYPGASEAIKESIRCARQARINFANAEINRRCFSMSSY